MRSFSALSTRQVRPLASLSKPHEICARNDVNNVLSSAECRLPVRFAPVRQHSSSAFLSHVNINDKEILEINRRYADEVLAMYDTILLDCDGVLWGTDHITHFAETAKVVKKMQNLGKQVLFVTNNSMHGRSSYVQKFHTHGFDAPAEDVFCVAYASAVYLKTILHVKGCVYTIGSPGMTEELNVNGIDNFGLGPDPDKVYDNISDLLHVPLRDNVGAVLVGYDKHFDMRKLFKACSYLMNPDCLYIATNDREKSVAIADGRRQPVTGAIVDCITSAAKRKPQVKMNFVILLSLNRSDSSGTMFSRSRLRAFTHHKPLDILPFTHMHDSGDSTHSQNQLHNWNSCTSSS
jgi:phosphoglycolate/pyridoxal phosphate phosphatase family enzyme